MSRWCGFLPLALIAASFATSAAADPCTAPLPERGSTFGGVVRYIGDGDSMCVGPTAEPSTWVEVRLADFYAPELHEPGGEAAKAALARVAKGKRAICEAGRRSYDRVVARCEIGGRDVGDLMRAAGVRQGGNGSR